jgi:hypothetical protein
LLSLPDNPNGLIHQNMKKYLVLLAVAISAACASAKPQVEQADSVAVTDDDPLAFDAGEVIEETSNNVICGNDHWNLIMKGIGFGLNSMLDTPAPMNGHRTVGTEFFWSDIFAVRYTPWTKGPSLSLGFGIAWANYAVNDGLRFARGEDYKTLECQDLEASVENGRSSIHTFSLVVPLSLHYTLKQNWKFQVGVWAMFTTHASESTSYKLDGIKYSESWNGLQKRTFRWSYIAQVGYKDLGFFVKYTPENAIKTGYGPQFKSLSAGLILGF